MSAATLDEDRPSGGASATEDVAPQRSSVFANVAAWLRTRHGWLSVWVFAAASLLVAALLANVYFTPFLNAPGGGAWFFAASVVFWLPLLLFFLDSSSNYFRGPAPTLPVLCAAVLFGLALFAIWDQWLGAHALVGANAVATRVAYFAFFALAFIPVAWNASNFARVEFERRLERAQSANSEEQARDETMAVESRKTEAFGALIATLAVLSVGILAFIAGNASESMSLKSGFGLVLCGLVIGVFAVVVLLDAFAAFTPVRAINRGFDLISRSAYGLAAFYNWIDEGLVRIGAWVSGMGHHSMKMRYGILISTLGSLALMGWFLPAPLGLLPVAFGFVLAVSVSRLWSWVEEDRALAAMTDYSPKAPYRMDFREDFRDETLLAFMFVFVFVPIAMMQAHNGNVFGPGLFENANGRNFSEWFGFFGLELAKAVPIVDWAEIYGVNTEEDAIKINGAASRHAVFLARVMVDLVLIAALTQAITIWARARQQKQLYHDRHIDRLDPFVERLELVRAIRATRKSGATPEFDLMLLRSGALVDFRRYDENQLRQIYAGSKDTDTRGFIEALAKQRNMPLTDAIDLAVEIAESPSHSEYDLFRAFERALEDHRAKVASIEPGDLFRILTALRAKSGLRDFKAKVVAVLAEVGRPEDVVEMLTGLVSGEHADGFQYARNEMAKTVGALTKRFGDVEAIKAVRRQMKAAGRSTNAPSAAALNSALRSIQGALEQRGVRTRN